MDKFSTIPQILATFRRISIIYKTIRDLGLTQTGLFALYQLGKHTGLWRLLTPQQNWVAYRGVLKTGEIIPVPAGYRAAIGEPTFNFLDPAEEIINGRVTLFGADTDLGADTLPLNLTIPGPLHHWTRHESSQFNGQDIKFIWEPARFGWVFPLARAYLLTDDERYPVAFWDYFEKFYTANPPNTGPNWTSAQEVGLRLIALTFAHRIFAQTASSTPARITHLGHAVAAHAARIPPTLLYARAQNNNHLLSEAAALYTAGLALPEHPYALRWRAIGWKWFHHGLQTQIEPDGTYAQYSTNYHRLMLQLTLWVHTLAQNTNQIFPILSLTRLAAATGWLLALCDPDTGRVPNLGPNDGAYILPFTHLPLHDYRPVLQAASRAFLGQPAFDPGKWDEMSLWLTSKELAVRSKQPELLTSHFSLFTPHCILTTEHSRAYLRAAHFRARPGHADQLHLDLWWRGLNLALDPGTYLYNADPPWDNPLTTAFVHNTLTVNNLDQMTRAGRFLYIDRAQATILERTPTRLVAEHDGYRKIGLVHRRAVEPAPNGWRITDSIIHHSKSTNQNSPFTIRLHWLLPDWEWKLDDNTLQIRSPHGWITLSITHYPLSITHYHLFRTGETLLGPTPSHPTWGWYSPTYGVKQPALSFAFEGEGKLPVSLVSEWRLPDL